MSDWSSNPCSQAVADWPESLRTAAAITSAACFPSILLWGPEGVVCAHNEAFRAAFAAGSDVSGNSLFSLNGWSELRPRLQRALEGESVCCRDFSFPAVHGGGVDIADRWFDCTLGPLKADDGRVLAVLGTLFDTTEKVAAQLLLNDARHRVRNTLAALRSILRRTSESAVSVDDFAMHLEGRLDAIARVQAATASSRSPGGLDLANLIADELDAAAARLGEDVMVEGPDILLTAKAGGRLALAFHELATNAIEYGALAEDGGRIQVGWRVDGGQDSGQISIVWKETGLQTPLVPPARRGFGMMLLRQSLPYELGAKVEVAFESDGLRCSIAVPVSEVIAENGAAVGRGPAPGR